MPLQDQGRHARGGLASGACGLHSHGMPIFRSTLAAAVLATLSPLATNAQSGRPVVAVFAHADDERVIAPLLAKLAREKRETHLVIATDGAKGIRDFANIPAFPTAASPRSTRWANCARHSWRSLTRSIRPRSSRSVPKVAPDIRTIGWWAM
jgi:hypothetical protein